MARPTSEIEMRKTALYLDWDAVTRVRCALKGIPGSPSLSALLSAELPRLADMLEALVESYETRDSQNVIALLQAASDVSNSHSIEARRTLKELQATDSIRQEKLAIDVPASKPKRQKKLA